MFDAVSEEAGTLAREAAVRVCWAQWTALGSLASPEKGPRPTAIIDVEALVMLSLTVRQHERRLTDLVAWWAGTSSRLTSVQRLRTVAGRFPSAAGVEATGLFAGLAAAAGDRRWARHAGPVPSDSARTGKGAPEPVLVDPCTLWPRLRAGFGVGAKADALVFLLGLRGAWASVQVIAMATNYSSVTVRKAVGDMSLARLIRETDGRPAEYLAPSRPWAELLQLSAVDPKTGPELRLPRWRFWVEIFSFLAWVEDWSRRSQLRDGRSFHSLASEARDILDRYSRAFDMSGIPTPPVSRFRGLEAANGLVETTRVVVEWMENKV